MALLILCILRAGIRGGLRERELTGPLGGRARDMLSLHTPGKGGHFIPCVLLADSKPKPTCLNKTVY